VEGKAGEKTTRQFWKARNKNEKKKKQSFAAQKEKKTGHRGLAEPARRSPK
jgi:hypothetical protein